MDNRLTNKENTGCSRNADLQKDAEDNMEVVCLMANRRKKDNYT